jgi:hypothetical protein
LGVLLFTGFAMEDAEKSSTEKKFPNNPIDVR